MRFRDEVIARCSGMTNQQMAEFFGVSEPYVSLVRRGLKGCPHLSRRMSGRALKAWPSLEEVYLRELRAEAEETEQAGVA